jgi:outer membrane protein TolC
VDPNPFAAPYPGAQATGSSAGAFWRILMKHVIFPGPWLPGLCLALGGCASLSPRVGGEDVNALLVARQDTGVAWAALASEERESVATWLDPLTAEGAVRVAMLRSPRLQQEYAALGLARADVLDALQVRNPGLSLSRQSITPGAGGSRTLGISLPLADLLLRPARGRLAEAGFERAKFRIAGAIMAVARDVEAAWYQHVGARQIADMRAAVAEGAEASADLAQRFYDAGNISELQLMQERAAASEARIAALRARAEAARTRLALNAVMGLDGEEAARWRGSERLPLPVASEDDPELLLRLARENSLELLAARRGVELQADALGLARRLRWLGDVDIGYEREREDGGGRLRGPSLDLQLPIFHQGQAGIARAEAHQAEARAGLSAAGIGVEGAIRQLAQEVRELAAIVALHRQALVPQREKVVERSQQEQNFMLIGVFELIQAKVKEYDAYQGYLEALRDYWLARVELRRVVGQRLPSDEQAGAPGPGVQDILGPSAGEGGHDGHHGHHGHQAAGPPAGKDREASPHAGHGSPPATLPADDGKDGGDATEPTPGPTDSSDEHHDHHGHHGGKP